VDPDDVRVGLSGHRSSGHRSSGQRYGGQEKADRSW
jgi:hypothetical protein